MIRKLITRSALAALSVVGMAAVSAGVSHAETPPITAPADPIPQAPVGDRCIGVDQRVGFPSSGWGTWSDTLVPCFAGPASGVAAKCAVSIGEFQLGATARRQGCRVDVYMFGGRLGGRTVGQRCAAMGGRLGSGRFHGRTWSVCRGITS